MARITTAATAIVITISAPFILFPPDYRPAIMQIQRARKAKTHATIHCQMTTPAAHFPPSSRRMEAMEATQGVYNRENTIIVTADVELSAAVMLPPNNISIVDTTLSLAMKPLIREVTIRQSPKARGAKSGTIQPEMVAIRLSPESVTRLK